MIFYAFKNGQSSLFFNELLNLYNRLLGFARLRQVRVRNDSCKMMHSHFSKFRLACYGPYSAAGEDTSPYGAGAIQYGHESRLIMAVASLKMVSPGAITDGATLSPKKTDDLFCHRPTNCGVVVLR